MDKFLNSKRKVNDDAFDDSFDFFLPNKLRERSILNKINEKSNNRHKKLRSSSRSSSSSQESYDSDMQQVMAVCLMQSKSDSISSVSPIKRNNSDWKELKSKMRRQPLLLTRTSAERETILSQKLALILVDNDEVSDQHGFPETNRDELIQSELLLDQCCKMCRLWSTAKQCSLKNKEYYVSFFSNYIDFNSLSDTQNMMITSELSPNFREFESFTPNELGVELQDSPILSHQPEETIREVENCSLDIFENSQSEKTSDNAQNDENIPASITDSCKSNERLSRTNSMVLTNKPKLEQAAPDVIEISSSPSSVHTPQLPFDNVSQRTISPPLSTSSISTRQWNSKIGMLDRIGLTLLALHMDALFDSNNGDVIVLLQQENKLYVHRFLLAARCEQLINELNDENQLDWTEWSLTIAKAFFRYVYCGKCDHLWSLSSEEKSLIKRLARVYHLSHLEEVLNKFHNFHGREHSSSKFDNTSAKITNIQSSTSTHSIDEPFHTNSPTSQVKLSEVKLNSTFEPHKFTYNETDDAVCTSPDHEFYTCDYAQPPVSPSPEHHNSSSHYEANNTFKPNNIRKSLERFFQDSSPGLPSDESFSMKAELKVTEPSLIGLNKKNYSSSCSDSSDLEGGVQHSFYTSFASSTISDTSDKSPSRSTHLLTLPSTTTVTISPKKTIKDTSDKSPSSSTDLLTLPSTSTATISLKKTIKVQRTPTASSSSDIIFSKNATPFPNYDEMITPQLEKELKKFGLRRDLGSTKAKLLLKYIYDQTHPLVDSSEEAPPTLQSSKDNSTNHSLNNDVSLTELVSKTVKNNRELYKHVLLFKPIWLENFHQLLKDNGIRCSVNELKDSLNELCVIYRTKNTRVHLARKGPRNRKPKRAT